MTLKMSNTGISLGHPFECLKIIDDAYVIAKERLRSVRARTLMNFMIPPMNGVPSKIGGDLAGKLLLMNLKITKASRAMPVPTAYSKGRGMPFTLASNSPDQMPFSLTFQVHRGSQPCSSIRTQFPHVTSTSAQFRHPRNPYVDVEAAREPLRAASPSKCPASSSGGHPH